MDLAQCVTGTGQQTHFESAEAGIVGDVGHVAQRMVENVVRRLQIGVDDQLPVHVRRTVAAPHEQSQPFPDLDARRVAIGTPSTYSISGTAVRHRYARHP